MRFRLTPLVAARLVGDPILMELSAEVSTNVTTEGLRMIDGRSVRCRWQTVPEALTRGLYACRCVVALKVVAVGLCCVDETMDKCELMVFPVGGGDVLSEQDQAYVFPERSKVELQLVMKTSEFSTMAHGPWLHDHIQRSVSVLDRWSRNKRIAPLTGKIRSSF